MTHTSRKNTKSIAFALAIAAMALAIYGSTSMHIQSAAADKSSATDVPGERLNKADDNVHDNTPGGEGGSQDEHFHEGISCHAGLDPNGNGC